MRTFPLLGTLFDDVLIIVLSILLLLRPFEVMNLLHLALDFILFQSTPCLHIHVLVLMFNARTASCSDFAEMHGSQFHCANML